tara:strand:+ start:1093 stop:1467 length:375 start_codon:yes stop_codon:yes gene_type:complete
MEANMTYKIKETNLKKSESEIDLTSLIAEVESTTPICSDISTDLIIALELYYSTNYNIKQLGQILDYYKINKRKMKKNEQIQAIIFYESDIENIHIVENRKRLWENIEELKSDPYFSKFILFNT